MAKESFTKEEIKSKLDGNVLDLSLCTLSKVPVREIALLPKATTLDLSCNSLTSLPATFPSLTQLTSLDLSKNNLSELPTDFGQLINLVRLDLYSNKLSCLPVSCYRLKKLKWLDVKGNPMENLLSDIVGNCLTDEECKQCAINVISYLKSQNADQERSRQKRLQAEREKKAAHDAQEKELRKRQKLLEKEERRAAFQEMERQKRKIVEDECTSSKTTAVTENIHLNNGIEEKHLKNTQGKTSHFHILITFGLVICLGLVLYYGYRTFKANYVL